MTKTMHTITFDGKLAAWIVKAMEFRVDEDGVVVNGAGKFVPDYEGKPVKFEDFAGVMKGKEGNLQLISKDICSIIDAADNMNWQSVESGEESAIPE